MAEKTLYLIRHAQPDYPGGEKMCLGRKVDLPLSACGAEQADRLGQFFRNTEIEAVYTSPLLRARQTAAPIAGQERPLHVLENLAELSGGEWDGLSFAEIRERYPQHFVRGAGFSCPPGGETDEEGLARARSALEYVLRRTQSSAAMVAHAGINRILLCALLGRPLSEKKRIAQDYAAVSVLKYAQGIWRVGEIDVRPEARTNR